MIAHAKILSGYNCAFVSAKEFQPGRVAEVQSASLPQFEVVLALSMFKVWHCHVAVDLAKASNLSSHSVYSKE